MKAIILLSLGLSLSAVSVAQQSASQLKQMQQYQQSKPMLQYQRLYTIGQLEFLFRTGDDSPQFNNALDAMARKQITNDEVRARVTYLQARSSHRKFENSFDSMYAQIDKKSSSATYNAYCNYLAKFEPQAPGQVDELSSDVRFYKVIYCLEAGKWKEAMGVLEHWHPEKDPAVYLDDIVWDSERDCSVKQVVPAAALKAEVSAYLGANDEPTFPDVYVKSLAFALKKWAAQYIQPPNGYPRRA